MKTYKITVMGDDDSVTIIDLSPLQYRKFLEFINLNNNNQPEFAPQISIEEITK